MGFKSHNLPMPITLHFPKRETKPHPWHPMTDVEWAALSTYLPTFGRPPRDRRRTWDGIFFIATSTHPWAALPPEFGRADTVHSALIHAARTFVLDRLLMAVSRHPLAPDDMQSMEWRVVRAVRRAARQVPAHTLELAYGLGLISALPWPPEMMPKRPEERPDLPREPVRPARLPTIPRRALRGVAPSRNHEPKPPPEAPERPCLPRRRLGPPSRAVAPLTGVKTRGRKRAKP